MSTTINKSSALASDHPLFCTRVNPKVPKPPQDKIKKERKKNLCFPSVINKAEFNIFFLCLDWKEKDICLFRLQIELILACSSGKKGVQ